MSLTGTGTQQPEQPAVVLNASPADVTAEAIIMETDYMSVSCSQIYSTDYKCETNVCSVDCDPTELKIGKMWGGGSYSRTHTYWIVIPSIFAGTEVTLDFMQNEIQVTITGTICIEAGDVLESCGRRSCNEGLESPDDCAGWVCDPWDGYDLIDVDISGSTEVIFQLPDTTEPYIRLGFRDGAQMSPVGQGGMFMDQVLNVSFN